MLANNSWLRRDYAFFRDVLHEVGEGASHVLHFGQVLDKGLHLAEKIPVVGKFAKDIENSPEYIGVRDILDAGGDILDYGRKYGGHIFDNTDKSLGYGYHAYDANKRVSPVYHGSVPVGASTTHYDSPVAYEHTSKLNIQIQ